METASRCRLLELPAELRTIIWTLAFTHDDHIDLVAAKDLSTALLSTCSQIYSEAISICEKACIQYWPTGRFEVNSDTSDAEIENLSDKNLRQVNYLKMTGRRETYIFTSGFWTCTKLCKSIIKDDFDIASGSCPDFAIYEANYDRQTSTVLPRRVVSCRHCPANCSEHSFVNNNAGKDLEKLLVEVGWQGLSKRELKAVLKWYKDVMEPLPGLTGISALLLR